MGPAKDPKPPGAEKLKHWDLLKRVKKVKSSCKLFKKFRNQDENKNRNTVCTSHLMGSIIVALIINR